jgi:mono/diheme cytochrome c family protein
MNIRIVLLIAIALARATVASESEPSDRGRSSAQSGVDWPLNGRTLDGSRYSPLGQIDAATVGRLGLAWEFRGFVVRGRTHRGRPSGAGGHGWQPMPEPISADAATLAHGRKLFQDDCQRCHVLGGAFGAYPSLWNMAPQTLASFDAIVLGGAYRYAGMANFSDVLSKSDVAAIKAFIVDVAGIDQDVETIHLQDIAADGNLEVRFGRIRG